jgi:RNA polymerase sigma factor for flagellar operon FliA
MHRTPRTNPSVPRSEAEGLVQRGLPLVGYLVAEAAGRVPRWVQRDDLVSAGMFGLAQAIRAWDPERNVAFEVFARLRIHGAILDELRRCDWATRSTRAEVRRHRGCVDALTAELGRTPRTEEIAEALGTSVTEVHRLCTDAARASVLSFEAVFAEPELTAPPAESPEPTDVLLDRELNEVLGDAIHALPERLRTVVVDYFFDERPMQAIADDLGVTESRVSQMRAEALALLRDGINSRLEPELVPDLAAPRGRVARRKAAYYAAVADAAAARASAPADRPLAAVVNN